MKALNNLHKKTDGKMNKSGPGVWNRISFEAKTHTLSFNEDAAKRSKLGAGPSGIERKRDKSSSPPAAHQHKSSSSSISVQQYALDLSKSGSIKKISNPLFVDDANDSRESESWSINSSILETQGNPTQPQSPPVNVSSGENTSTESSVLLLLKNTRKNG